MQYPLQALTLKGILISKKHRVALILCPDHKLYLLRTGTHITLRDMIIQRIEPTGLILKTKQSGFMQWNLNKGMR